MTRPLLTFDLDGVLCRPPLGINPGRGIGKSRDGEGTKSILWRTERWRYLGRRPMPGAREGLERLMQDFDCLVVSARAEHSRGLTAEWLRTHLGVAIEARLRTDWREKPAQFKTRMLAELRPVAHFEDDAHTAEWAAELVPHVFLVDWWRNRWLEKENVHRIERLSDALPLLSRVVEGVAS